MFVSNLIYLILTNLILMLKFLSLWQLVTPLFYYPAQNFYKKGQERKKNKRSTQLTVDPCR